MAIIDKALEKIQSFLGVRLVGTYRAQKYPATLSFEKATLEWVRSRWNRKSIEMAFAPVEFPRMLCTLHFLEHAMGPFHPPLSKADAAEKAKALASLDHWLKRDYGSAEDWKPVQRSVLWPYPYLSFEVIGALNRTGKTCSTYDVFIPAGAAVILIHMVAEGKSLNEQVLNDLRTIARTVDFPNQLEKRSDARAETIEKIEQDLSELIRLLEDPPDR